MKNINVRIFLLQAFRLFHRHGHTNLTKYPAICVIMHIAPPAPNQSALHELLYRIETQLASSHYCCMWTNMSKPLYM